MEITIYTKSSCSYCGKIKELLERVDLEYTEKRLGVDFTSEDFRRLFPNERGYPRLLIDGELIGGLTESVKYFVERGMITSKRK